jgi:integrase
MGTLPKDRKTVWTDCALDIFARTFLKERARLVSKLQNPRLGAIHWHTLRHLKGTMEYHRTRDIVYVQRTLGHRSIQSTLGYVQLLPYGKDEYIAKAALTLEDVTSLVQDGFDFVTKLDDGTQVFRKRK